MNNNNQKYQHIYLIKEYNDPPSRFFYLLGIDKSIPEDQESQEDLLTKVYIILDKRLTEKESKIIKLYFEMRSITRISEYMRCKGADICSIISNIVDNINQDTTLKNEILNCFDAKENKG